MFFDDKRAVCVTSIPATLLLSDGVATAPGAITFTVMRRGPSSVAMWRDSTSSAPFIDAYRATDREVARRRRRATWHFCSLPNDEITRNFSSQGDLLLWCSWFFLQGSTPREILSLALTRRRGQALLWKTNDQRTSCCHHRCKQRYWTGHGSQIGQRRGESCAIAHDVVRAARRRSYRHRSQKEPIEPFRPFPRRRGDTGASHERIHHWSWTGRSLPRPGAPSSTHRCGCL